MPLGLDTCGNINYDPLASIKRLLSVPRSCVLPEDMVSGLAVHGVEDITTECIPPMKTKKMALY